jgi:hypothetical protein
LRVQLGLSKPKLAYGWWNHYKTLKFDEGY